MKISKNVNIESKNIAILKAKIPLAVRALDTNFTLKDLILFIISNTPIN